MRFLKDKPAPSSELQSINEVLARDFACQYCPHHYYQESLVTVSIKCRDHCLPGIVSDICVLSTLSAFLFGTRSRLAGFVIVTSQSVWYTIHAAYPVQIPVAKTAGQNSTWCLA